MPDSQISEDLIHAISPPLQPSGRISAGNCCRLSHRAPSLVSGRVKFQAQRRGFISALPETGCRIATPHRYGACLDAKDMKKTFLDEPLYAPEDSRASVRRLARPMGDGYRGDRFSPGVGGSECHGAPWVDARDLASASVLCCPRRLSRLHCRPHLRAVKI